MTRDDVVKRFEQLDMFVVDVIFEETSLAVTMKPRYSYEEPVTVLFGTDKILLMNDDQILNQWFITRKTKEGTKHV